jgi:hypothetical protein
LAKHCAKNLEQTISKKHYLYAILPPLQNGII